ncbi:MAG: hypothetical protein OXE58_06055 [Acidobacteria bacterium]|nr:hypothetical protein [Acidobacteriota bacterium]
MSGGSFGHAEEARKLRHGRPLAAAADHLDYGAEALASRPFAEAGDGGLNLGRQLLIRVGSRCGLANGLRPRALRLSDGLVPDLAGATDRSAGGGFRSDFLRRLGPRQRAPAAERAAAPVAPPAAPPAAAA